jgi:PAS domain S-box-containing protein
MVTAANCEDAPTGVRFGIAGGTAGEPAWEFLLTRPSESERSVLTVDVTTVPAIDCYVAFMGNSDQHFWSAFRTARAAPFTWNVREDRFVIHPILMDLLGLPAEFRFASLNGIYLLIHPDDRGKLAAEIADRLCSASQIGTEVRVVLPDGSSRWFSGIGGVERAGSGQVAHVHGIALDITPRKAAEYASRESEEKFRVLFESSPAGMVLFSDSGVIIDVNEAFCRFMHLTPADVPGRAVREMVHSEDRQALAPGVFSAEVRYVLRDGAEIWGQSSTVRLPLPEGGSACLTAVLDITALKLAERILRKREEHFRVVANDTPAYLWTTTPDSGKRFANTPLLDFLGLDEWPPEAHWTAWVHPDDVQQALDTFQRVFHDRLPYESEYRLRRHDGQYRWMLSRATPRFSAAGEFLGYAGAVTDIDDRKCAEMQIRSLMKQLITAQETERTRLARELHDDLSQQIAGLSIGMSNLRRRLPDDSPDLNAQVERLHGGLVALARSLRNLSHQLHPWMLDLAGVAAALEACCSEFSALTGIEVVFRTEGPAEGAGPEIALCLYRITQEALQNVARHSGSNRAEVTLTRRPAEWLLTIQDGGFGFDTSDPTSGLGFVSMRERLRLVNGTLSIDSRRREGTTLTVTIPAA